LAPAEAHAASADDDYHGSSLSAEKLKDLLWRTLNFLVSGVHPCEISGQTGILQV
jgi:hypothetical protein